MRPCTLAPRCPIEGGSMSITHRPRLARPLRLALTLCLAGGISVLLLWAGAPVQAAGVVTDCSSPSGPNGLYTKLGGGGLVSFNCPGPGPIVITVSGSGGMIPAGNTTLDGSN